MPKKEDKHRIEISSDELLNDELRIPNESEVEDEDDENKSEITSDQLAEDISLMQVELERLKQDAAKSRDEYMRTLADFDNFRKRQREELVRQKDLARENIILKLLPIVDNFERASVAAEQQNDYDALVEGVTLVLKQLKDMLTAEGLEPIKSEGEQFNPEIHEAVMRDVTDEYPEETIVQEFEPGFTLNGKVIRPAKVRVAVSE